MRNQEDRFEIDATHLTQKQVCELLEAVMEAISKCVEKGHSVYLRSTPNKDVHSKFSLQR